MGNESNTHNPRKGSPMLYPLGCFYYDPAYLTSINAPDVAERAVFPQSMSYEEKV